ncbi:MAG: hypothetical protein FJ125_00690, partial [Deltaproteobacteria bacterium]|nr:hypothetical protein [Deltaproteobacteria bacterium]
LSQGVWRGTIPGFSVMAPAVEYYLRAADTKSNSSVAPATAPDQPYRFTVNAPDNTPPTVQHTPVANGQPAGVALTVEAAVVDASGLTSVTLYHRRTGQQAYAELAMTDRGDGTWRAALPGEAVQEPGVQYYLVAIDAAAARNRTTVPATAPNQPHSFTVLPPVARPVPGDLIITEIMADPAAVADSAGEWFEIHVAAAHELELSGLRISDETSNAFVVQGSLRGQPGDHLVFGRNADPLVNGGVVVDYAYGAGMSLANSADQIILTSLDGQPLDQVAYDFAGGWPQAGGASLQLDGGLDPRQVDNADAAHWCKASVPIHAGAPADLGTPGTANPECVVVDLCDPNPCTDPPAAECADGDTVRRYPGPGSCADQNGVVVCSYGPVLVDCGAGEVCRGGQCVSGVVPVGWCRLQSPQTVTVGEGVVTTYYGRVYQQGITDRSTAVDVSPDLRAELGWGPDGTLPAGNAAWQWVVGGANAGWNGQAAGEPDNDEYQADLAAPAAGRYDFAWRFSADRGLSWTYCDGGAPGSSDGYQVDFAGDLQVRPPVDPCLPNPCTAPPAAICDGNTVVGRASPGICTAVGDQAACTYAEQRVACAAGQICHDGACADDPCLPNPCTSAPAAGCVDDRTRRSYTSPGSCRVADAQAECSYTYQDVACPANQVCNAGLCEPFVSGPQPGDLVVTEIMADPKLVGDSVGEWFEVYNASGEVLELAGVTFKDNGSNIFRLSQESLQIQPDRYMVFGRSANRLTNGGVVVDYAYGSGMTLSNGTADAIVIINVTGEEVDRVEFDAGAGWPYLAGMSIQLDGALDPAEADNGSGLLWCLSRELIDGSNPASDRGTPGAANPGCRVAVDFCRLQAPLPIPQTSEGVLTSYTGRVRVEGVTTSTPAVDVDPFLRGELGYGPDGSQPDGNAGWTWKRAVANPGWNGVAAGEAANDEYQVALAAPAPGRYDVAFRFTADGGASWTYCDGGAGSTDGYDPAQAGDLHVIPPANLCDPNPCNTPPAPRCEGVTAVIHGAPGTCTPSGAQFQCAYAQERQDCSAAGQRCAEGACVANPCQPNPCNAPPADECANATTRRTYPALGQCSVVGGEAECVYAPVLAACAAGQLCENSRCGAAVPGPVPGDLVITELMIDPAQVSDTAGEWFEVYNASGRTLELAGVVFADLGSNSFRVGAATLLSRPGSYLVFGRNGDPLANGGVTVDHVYGSAMSLNNTSADQVIIENVQGQEVARVEFGGAGWLRPSGASLQLDGDLDPGVADSQDPASWCVARQAIRAGQASDKGTPGAPNHGCAPPAIDFCRLQAPLVAETNPGRAVTVTGRVFEKGVTDRTAAVDAEPGLVGQLGWGPDGSAPAGNAGWSWIAATPGPGWDGAAAGEPGHDEYRAVLTAPAAGRYDFAFRFTIDSGASWTYCDGGAGSGDGYQPAQAGDLRVNVPFDACNPNPCIAPPADECLDAATLRRYPMPGSCVAEEGQARCSYDPAVISCSQTEVCQAGACVRTVFGPRPGDLVITEIMLNPKLVSDGNGEWFEVYNAAEHTLDLAGLTVADEGGESFRVAGEKLLPAGSFFVFGRKADANVNGRVTVDHAYSGMDLTQSEDELILRNAEGEEITRLAYTAAWTRPEGASLQLSRGLERYRPLDNGAQGSWCVSDDQWGALLPGQPATDKGSPGHPNGLCPGIPVHSCVLTAPLQIETLPGAATTVFGRVLQPGITDEGPGVNVHPQLKAELGWGPDASAPAGNAAWIWLAASPNPAWDGALAGEPALDEYLAELSAPAPGRYDYTYRFSANGGASWTYCAGAVGDLLVIDLCQPNPCNDAPPAACDGRVALSYGAPGACLAVGEEISCTYAEQRLDCAPGGLCAAGGCVDDPCEPNPCNAPPAPDCAGEATRRSYPAEGSCTVVEQQAQCRYEAVETPCAANELCTEGVCFDPRVVPVGFCRLQPPLRVQSHPGEENLYRGRIYQQGTTDLTDGVDAAEALKGELGYGPDGSDPADDEGWQWSAAVANPDWDATAAGAAGQDEYQLSLAAPAPGSYDFAFRFTADGGISWTYCDGDEEGSLDGYEPAEAGELLVEPEPDPCLDNPCTAPPEDVCEGDVAVQYPQVGTCRA